MIFKKRSKEWQYGTVTRDVNGRSYIIRDGFGNHFRRNRRFIRRSTNKDTALPDMPIEDQNIEYSQKQINPFELPTASQHDVLDRSPVFVSQPQPTSLKSNNGTDEDSARAVSPGLSPTLASSPRAESYIDPILSQPQSNLHDFLSNEPQSECQTSRKGRLIKPPQRYGEWHY